MMTTRCNSPRQRGPCLALTAALGLSLAVLFPPWIQAQDRDLTGQLPAGVVSETAAQKGAAPAAELADPTRAATAAPALDLTRLGGAALCLAAGLILLVSWLMVKARCDVLEREIWAREVTWEREVQLPAPRSAAPPTVVPAGPQTLTRVGDSTASVPKAAAKAVQVRALTDALYDAEKELHRTEKLIEEQRSTLFGQMHKLALEHQRELRDDYGTRYQRELLAIHETYRNNGAALKDQHAQECMVLQSKCQGLSEVMESVKKDLAERRAERDELQQRYDGRSAELASLQQRYEGRGAELDSARQRYGGKVAELDRVMGVLYPELYQGFLDLLAALPEKATLQPYTPEAAAQHFCLATAEFRLLFHLCLTLRSLRDGLPEADDPAAATLRLHLRELFHGVLDPHVLTFQSDPGVLAGLREGLAPLLNEHVLGGHYRCWWPRRGEMYNPKHHQLNEVGGNVIRAARSATLIDVQTGDVVFKAVVDTGS